MLRNTYNQGRVAYVNIVQSCNLQDSKLRRIPISSNNELPRAIFSIGLALGYVTLTALYDTGEALNTGSVYQHQHIHIKLPYAAEILKLSMGLVHSGISSSMPY